MSIRKSGEYDCLFRFLLSRIRAVKYILTAFPIVIVVGRFKIGCGGGRSAKSSLEMLAPPTGVS